MCEPACNKAFVFPSLTLRLTVIAVDISSLNSLNIRMDYELPLQAVFGVQFLFRPYLETILFSKNFARKPKIDGPRYNFCFEHRLVLMLLQLSRNVRSSSGASMKGVEWERG